VKGVPLTALACCAYDATMGIGVLNDGPIKKPADLEGRTLASTATSGEYPLLPAFAGKAGFDLAKVKRIQVDNKVRDRLLAEGKVDAISGFASSAMPNYIATGTKAHFMLYSDWGIANSSNAVLTQPQRVKDAPQLCAAVVEGLLQGLKATMLDPEAAMQVFFKQVPEMALAAQARTQIKVGTGIMIYVSARDTATTKGLGWIDPKEFAEETDLVMKYLAAPGDKPPEAAQMSTNRFTGSVKLTDAEWQQVQKSAQGFRSYVT
jgi:NitT/TauT family transport system substrate-binding protein